MQYSSSTTDSQSGMFITNMKLFSLEMEDGDKGL